MMRELLPAELREFDARVRRAEAGAPRPTRPGAVPSVGPDTDATIAYRFGIRIEDVRRLKVERAQGALL